MSEYKVSPIGEVLSPFREKFGIPRQAGIISTVESKIRLYDEFSDACIVKGLENFSHIWVIFLFHENIEKGWKKMVRPPRLGGNKKIGVLASRAPFRPNFIGTSAVKLVNIEHGKNIFLTVLGADIADKTPVIDIKPYVKFADAVDNADSGIFNNPPEKKFNVLFSMQAKSVCALNKGLEVKLIEILSYDIRPAYIEENGGVRNFGIKFETFNIRFTVEKKNLYIVEIQ
ncbi:MAG: tRNA (N6-threonylcarbamoyladenosine(37)-N6)-methyltransferase TrmO [Thermodesulfobacteriota bacterium]